MYFKSAKGFSEKSLCIENKNKEFNNEQQVQLAEENAKYAIASVIYSVMSIEAHINELFCQAKYESSNEIWGGLDCDIVSRLSRIWEVDMQPPNTNQTKTYSLLDALHPEILDKYQLALTVCDKSLFDTGIQQYQDIKDLIKLRNSTVHYKPDLTEYNAANDRKTVNQKLEERLRRKINSLNPFYPEQNPFFPDKCFGSGCAQWAVSASQSFIKEFRSRIGVKTYNTWFE
jgi:hypothetical protein